MSYIFYEKFVEESLISKAVAALDRHFFFIIFGLLFTRKTIKAEFLTVLRGQFLNIQSQQISKINEPCH